MTLSLCLDINLIYIRLYMCSVSLSLSLLHYISQVLPLSLKLKLVRHTHTPNELLNIMYLAELLLHISAQNNQQKKNTNLNSLKWVAKVVVVILGFLHIGTDILKTFFFIQSSAKQKSLCAIFRTYKRNRQKSSNVRNTRALVVRWWFFI